MKSYSEITGKLLALQDRPGKEGEVAYGIWYWYNALKLSPAVEMWLGKQDLDKLVTEIAERWDGERYLAGVKDALLAYYKENEQ